MKVYADGQVLPAADLNGDLNDVRRINGLNAIQQVIDRSITQTSDGGYFVEAYVDADGRQNTVNTTLTSAAFDTDNYSASAGLIIEASSLATSDFSINSCTATLVSAGKWLLTADGAYEVARARIYKTMFYGSNGSDARATATYITSLTALKTLDARDVGKYATYTSMSMTNLTADATQQWDFSDVATNTNCSAWSSCYTDETFTNGPAQFEFPNGTVVNSMINGTNDEMESDTSADINDNPAVAESLMNYQGTGHDYTIEAFMLHTGTVSTGSTTGSGFTSTLVDFQATHSMPAISLGDADDFPAVVWHEIPAGTFSHTLDASFATVQFDDHNSDSTTQYKLEDATALINANSFVEVDASEATASEIEINGCILFRKSAGVWIVGNTDTDDEVARAKIHETLFRGTDGTDPRVVSGFSGITSMKTSVTRDEGKRAHYASVVAQDNNDSELTGTFVDTSSNTDCSSWSSVEMSNGGTDEFGTDRTADEADNPADCQLQQKSSATAGARWELASGNTLNEDAAGTPGVGDYVKALVLCSGDITWVESGSGTPQATFTTIDFYDEHSIPDFTSGASLPSAQETDWLDINEVSEFTAFVNEPRLLGVKLEAGDGGLSINGTYLLGDRP